MHAPWRAQSEITQLSRIFSYFLPSEALVYGVTLLSARVLPEGGQILPAVISQTPSLPCMH